eukprot:CAMPEP_0174938654 /NCGR_PEP_ID=MMETSP1355-20121228/64154_1 /TAXON_ID=464990 /ORGANISM="Hemiselmis tepida, Strain CCMP443" /LENGTH=55 /DNA_ID=CAMNT_0016185599 /DNA_START=71 /DNA_END=238 /DNA_ORIENTATION=+
MRDSLCESGRSVPERLLWAAPVRSAAAACARARFLSACLQGSSSPVSLVQGGSLD